MFFYLINVIKHKIIGIIIYIIIIQICYSSLFLFNYNPCLYKLIIYLVIFYVHKLIWNLWC